MTFVPISRFFTVLMAGVVCFGLIVPLAIMRHDMTLARVIIALYVAYVAFNALLWIWQRKRA
jgi:hypothetical protein